MALFKVSFQFRWHVQLVPHNEPIVDFNRENASSEDSDDSDDEQGELITRVNEYFDKDTNEQDPDDGPDWMFKDDELPSKDPEYVFCPAPHRIFFFICLRSILSAPTLHRK